MSSAGWSSSMARLRTFFLTRVGRVCSFWIDFLGISRCLPGRSYNRLLPEPERDLESQYDLLLPGDRSQNGSVREQDYAKKFEETLQQVQGECSRLKAQIADLEAQLKEERANSSSRIEELQSQLQGQRILVANWEDHLKKLQNYYEGQVAAQREEVQKLVQQLELAEHQNSHNFAGGESFLDSGPTPHLLNKAVERVNQASGTFTKLLMVALKSGGVDCTKEGKALAPSVSFERASHTKYVYQALVCKVLFADFESECFNIEENATKCLDPEQPQKDNFQRYQELISLENPEELVYEDATDGDFRRFCIKKANELIDTLSLTGAPGVDDVRALICGQVFGHNGISRGSESAEAQSQIKLAIAFVKCALSVFLVHKLSFSMHPIARIFRLYGSVEFSPEYMEPVIALADSDDEGDDPVPLDVGFMVIPGFYVNRIVVHSRVYAVRRA